MGFASISAPSFKNLEGILSIPGALETSKQHSSFLVMFSVMYRSSNFSVFGFGFLWVDQGSEFYNRDFKKWL